MCPIIKKKELTRNRSRDDPNAGITGKNTKEAAVNILGKFLCVLKFSVQLG